MEIKRIESQLMVIWWILDQQPSARDHARNLFLLILPPKPNMLKHLKPLRKSFGFRKYSKICKRNKKPQLCYLSTTFLQFNWPRILSSMIEPNISTPSIIWHHVEAKTIHLTHCLTSEKIADIFTKALGCEKIEKFRSSLGISDIPSN